MSTTSKTHYRRIFASNADRQYFLQLLETHSEQRAVRIAAYTLMSNHFHLVAVGDQPDAISLFMMDVNGRYATYRHALERRSGKFWQGRFYSCVLDDAHWETALRYVELNPIRARIVDRMEDFRWSSARAHLGLEPEGTGPSPGIHRPWGNHRTGAYASWAWAGVTKRTGELLILFGLVGRTRSLRSQLGGRWVGG